MWYNNAMFKLAKDFYKKYEEVLRYLIVGVIGMIISIFSYYLCRNFDLHYAVSNVISWVVTVIVVYVLNRKYVFKSKSDKILKEFISFVLVRIFTLFLETATIWLVVDVIHGNDIVGKFLGQFVVIVSNYLFSKFFIFKKK